MLDLFFDLETNSYNPYTAEIIEGYFELYDCGNLINSYHFKSRINNWSKEAEAIHGIKESTAKKHPKKEEAFFNLINWLPKKPYRAICYVNPNTELGCVWFDIACLQMNLMNHLNVNRVQEQPFNPKQKLSVYNLAKQAASERRFIPIRNSGSNRESFRMEDVYFAMYNKKYKAHRAASDTKAMVKLFNDFNKEPTKRNKIKKQLTLV